MKMKSVLQWVTACLLIFSAIGASAAIPCGGKLKNVKIFATSPTSARVTFDAAFPDHGLAYTYADYILEVTTFVTGPHGGSNSQIRRITSKPICYSKIGCLVPPTFGLVCQIQGGCSGNGWAFDYTNLTPNSRYVVTLDKHCGVPNFFSPGSEQMSYAHYFQAEFWTPPVPPPPSCSLPQPAVTTPLVGATSGTVCWKAVPGASAYSFGAKTLGGGWQWARLPGSQTCAGTASLSPNTMYVMTVKSVCANGLEGKWGDVTFFATSPTVPSGLHINARIRATTGLTYVSATWNSVPNAKYRFAIRERRSNGSYGPWSIVVIPTNFISSHYVKHNVVYQIKVASISLIREDAQESAYSPIVEFTG